MQACESCGKSVWLFPGQGSPFLGMGKSTYQDPLTKPVWQCASEMSGIDLRLLCQQGPINKLNQTRYQQLAITAVNVALWLKWQHSAAEHSASIAVAGHSAGEYAALYAAGSLDLPMLFSMVDFRARLMQSLAKQQAGVMYVIKQVDFATLQRWLAAYHEPLVNIACDNSQQQQVISGERQAVKRFVHYLLVEQQVTAIKLPVNGAWHSPLMADGVVEMQQMLAPLSICPPQKIVYMNYSAAPTQDVLTIKQQLAQQLVHRVRWRETLLALWQAGYRQFYEFSGKKVLLPLLSDAAWQAHSSLLLQHIHQ